MEKRLLAAFIAALFVLTALSTLVSAAESTDSPDDNVPPKTPYATIYPMIDGFSREDSYTIAEGTSHTFPSGIASYLYAEVENANGKVTYQWQQKTGMSTWSDIPGEIGESYKLRAGSSLWYYFRCVVTNTTALGSLSNTSDQYTVKFSDYKFTGGTDVTGIDAPVAGKTPDTDASCTGNCTVYGITWDPNDTTFAGETVYTVTVTVAASSGYRFKPGTTATLNGKTPTSCTLASNLNSITLTYTYAATGHLHKYNSTYQHNKYTHWQVCTECGASSAPQEHTYGEWQYSYKPTASMAGEQYRRCTVCGYEQTREVPATGTTATTTKTTETTTAKPVTTAKPEDTEPAPDEDTTDSSRTETDQTEPEGTDTDIISDEQTDSGIVTKPSGIGNETDAKTEGTTKGSDDGKKSNPTILVIIICVILVAAIIVAVALMNRKKKVSAPSFDDDDE